jgi:uncharacterized protein (TIGR03435 family)
MLLITFLLLVADEVVGQSGGAGPAFEAAVVKLNRTGGVNGFFPSPGRLRVTNSTFRQLVEAVFHRKTGTLDGLKGWMESKRYDIEGSAPAAAGFDDELLMLQALLVERFHLRFHFETRDLTVLGLLKSKGGVKIQPARVAGQKERITIRPGEISGTNIPFGHFVTVLQAQTGFPITNETGISGEFDFTFKYDPEDSAGVASGTSVFAALDDQLGLRLERRKGPMEVMVIDSAEEPTSSEN